MYLCPLLAVCIHKPHTTQNPSQKGAFPQKITGCKTSHIIMITNPHEENQGHWAHKPLGLMALVLRRGGSTPPGLIFPLLSPHPADKHKNPVTYQGVLAKITIKNPSLRRGLLQKRITIWWLQTRQGPWWSLKKCSLHKRLWKCSVLHEGSCPSQLLHFRPIWRHQKKLCQ